MWLSLDLSSRHTAGPVPVGTMRVLGAPLAAQQPVERGVDVVSSLRSGWRAGSKARHRLSLAIASTGTTTPAGITRCRSVAGSGAASDQGSE
jgi:hypothetical protein